MSFNLPDEFRLDGKIALVTGASRGIGEAVAQGLAASGAKVVLAARKQEGVDAAVGKIRDAGFEAAGIPAHVGKDEAIGELVDFTVETYGGVDVLVNNAATNPVFGPVLDQDAAALDKVHEVNVRGPFVLAQKLQPIMAERGGGSIINMASMAGIAPMAGLGMYSVSKAALIHLTKVLASEWGAAGIRANAVCPGLIKTKFSSALWQDEGVAQSTVAQLAIPRLGEPDDVAGVTVFLASDAARYCTGGVYTVDGGYTIA